MWTFCLCDLSTVISSKPWSYKTTAQQETFLYKTTKDFFFRNSLSPIVGPNKMFFFNYQSQKFAGNKKPAVQIVSATALKGRERGGNWIAEKRGAKVAGSGLFRVAKTKRKGE